MDRRHLIVDISLCGLLSVFVGCVGLPGAPADPDYSTAQTTPGLPGPSPHIDDGETSVPRFDEVISLPDVSISPPRAPSSSAPWGVTGLTEEFHLSAHTGWLLLPVPRITDDLSQPEPDLDHLRIGGLHLPEIIDKPLASDAAEVGTDGVVLSAVLPGNRVGPRTPGAGSNPLVTEGDLTIATGDMLVVVGGAQNTENDTRAGVAAEPRGENKPPFVANDAEINVNPPPSNASASGDIRRSSVHPSESAATVAVPRESSSVSAGPTLNPSPEEYWSRRSAVVDPGSDVVVVLPGTDWFYVGREYGSGTADLVEKSSEAGDDEFTFRLSEAGEYGLWFQREDGLTGTISNERLELSTSPGADSRISVVRTAESLPDRAPANLRVTSSDEPAVVEIVPDAEPDVSVNELPSGADDRPDWLARADAAYLAGDIVAAAENYKKVLATGGDRPAVVRQRFFQVAAAGTDPVVLREAVTILRENGEFGESELSVALESGGLSLPSEDSLRLLEAIGSGTDLAGIDAVYFRLAGLLTQPSANRDLKRARELYLRIVQDFPLSSYWDESSHNIQYLDRHFFDVR